MKNLFKKIRKAGKVVVGAASAVVVPAVVLASGGTSTFNPSAPTLDYTGIGAAATAVLMAVGGFFLFKMIKRALV
jgi:hypothetical protein